MYSLKKTLPVVMSGKQAVTAVASQTRWMSKYDQVGVNRFTEDKFEAAVPADTWAAWQAAITTGGELPKDHTKVVAAAIFDWARERGAVQFSHWFFPHRGMKAGTKLDAFMDLDFGSDKALKPIVSPKFNAGMLFVSETDGSSFPNGGLRATHTAAAFMNWDRTSPPFVKGDTIYFPSAFSTWAGDSIDYKTPLLRSQRAVSDESVRLLKHLGHSDVKRVHANVGWEQEFFIVPLEVYKARPDLIAGGRTVIGAVPTRNQQLSDHYFSRIQPRVKAYLEDLQTEMWKVGISNTVLHNEVAPGQHELCPVFSLTNVAADMNILTTELMEEMAAEHELKVLFHEKPFAGINGSGKHCNWGLNTDTGINLCNPGDGEGEFVAFTAALLHAVHKYPAVLRASIASLGNDFRLGGHEAPPAILSMYAGPTLGAHLEAVANDGAALDGYKGGRYGGKVIDSGAPELGPVGAGVEDRNRTAPIPFCGNRFEYRAVGSAANISPSMTAMNTTVAESLSVISDKIEAGASPRDAVAEVLSDSMPAMFNGDGYNPAWHQEAEFERGLPNLRNTPISFEAFDCQATKDLFSKHKVLSEAEVDSYVSINLDEYSMSVEVEAATMLNMINQGVLPAAAADLKSYDGTKLAGGRAAAYEKLAAETAALQAANDAWPEGEKEAAFYAADVVKPAMDSCRDAHDAAEVLISSDLYPFPTYEQMIHGHHMDGRGF